MTQVQIADERLFDSCPNTIQQPKERPGGSAPVAEGTGDLPGHVCQLMAVDSREADDPHGQKRGNQVAMPRPVPHLVELPSSLAKFQNEIRSEAEDPV